MNGHRPRSQQVWVERTGCIDPGSIGGRDNVRVLKLRPRGRESGCDARASGREGGSRPAGTFIHPVLIRAPSRCALARMPARLAAFRSNMAFFHHHQCHRPRFPRDSCCCSQVSTYFCCPASRPSPSRRRDGMSHRSIAFLFLLPHKPNCPVLHSCNGRTLQRQSSGRGSCTVKGGT